MTILDDGLEAQKQDRFKEWYLSLSDDERKDFDYNLVLATGKILEAFNSMIRYFADNLPFVFGNFLQLLIDLSESLKNKR